MSYANILFEEADGVATLTLNRPAALNALTTELIEEMIDAVDRIRDEGTARCLLLTGAGRAFCSGADLAVGGATGSGRAGPPDAGARLESHFNPLLERLFALPVPFITAVNGPAAGAGCSFALAGDIVLAGEVRLFPAGVRQHRPGPRRRLDLAAAAPRRARAGAGDDDARRAHSGGAGARLGADLADGAGRRAGRDRAGEWPSGWRRGRHGPMR